MKTRILVAGLSLRIRARLQGQLRDVEVESVRNAEQLRQRLTHETFAALVVDEPILDVPVLEFLASIAQTFHGVIIFCAAGAHSANNLRLMVQRHHVAVILQHPVDTAELLRSLVVQLGLQIRQIEKKSTHDEELQLDEVWAQHQGTIEERIQSIQAAIEASDNPEKIEQAWRSAHLLTGSLGSFGFHQGTLLAREAEGLLECAMNGQPPNLERLSKLLGVLRSVVTAHRTTKPVSWSDSVLVAYSRDEELLSQLEVESLLNHWSLAICDDLAELSHVVGELGGQAVFIDLEQAPSQEALKVLDELSHDLFPCVVLSDHPLPELSLPGLNYLTRESCGPFLSYEIILQVLRSQLGPISQRPPGILVVDDDKIVLKVISNMLTKIDLYVQTLHSPLEFWDTLEQMKPDLVILDVDLPPLGGIELCRALRADQRYMALPVMFVSSYNDAQTLQKCFGAGADDYIYKPVSGLELTTRVTNRLERTRQISNHAKNASQSVHPYSSLDQMLLRALREGAPACLVRIEIRLQPDNQDAAQAKAVDPKAQAYANRVQRVLRKALRVEDVIKPLGPLEILVGMAGVERAFAQRRLQGILPQPPAEIQLRFGFSTFPEQGTDLEALIELARPSQSGSAG